MKITDEKLKRYLVIKIPYETSAERNALRKIGKSKGGTYTEDDTRSLPFLKVFWRTEKQRDYITTLEKRLSEELGEDLIQHRSPEDEKYSLETLYYDVSPPAIVLCDSTGAEITKWVGDIDIEKVIETYQSLYRRMYTPR